MRIIGGEFKSRPISMPKGVKIRPTQDKVREAVFNILGDITGKRVLELFAGSGAFGIEALSRGSDFVTFVENNPKCTYAISDNLDMLGMGGSHFNIIRSDAIKAIPKLADRGEKFDIIFMDPPYHEELAKKCLINVDSYDILSPIGFVIVEHFKKDILSDNLNRLLLHQERRYGDAVITIFRKAHDKSQDSGLPGNI